MLLYSFLLILLILRVFLAVMSEEEGFDRFDSGPEPIAELVVVDFRVQGLGLDSE